MTMKVARAAFAAVAVAGVLAPATAAATAVLRLEGVTRPGAAAGRLQHPAPGR